MPDLWVLDGVSGAWARLESPEGVTVQLPVVWLPRDAREGSVLSVTLDSKGSRRTVMLEVDAEATAQRRASAKGLRDRLPRAPDGDLDL
jgi:hypothetical protein